jgi:hypothetical protein
MYKQIALVFGVLSCVFWLIAYVFIIVRGFKDKAFAMPITGLCANISWELIYGFIYEPYDYANTFSIAWFLLDIPIAWQCYAYGAKDFKDRLISENFRLIFFFNLVASFTIVYTCFYEFKDFYGSYTGHGNNLMFSILYIAMLLRRNSIDGQSMYIAVSRSLGTLFALLGTAFDVMGDLNTPLNIYSILTIQQYPFSPLIRALYFFTFIIDLTYIILLYQKIKEVKINPWQRI